MTLQTDLQDAVTRVQTDSQLLHTIIHGDVQTVVTTEGGDVKSPAKVIYDIEETIQSQLTDLGITSLQLADAVSQAQDHAQTAEAHAQAALISAQALNLPENLQRQAGKLLAVNDQEDGYEVIESQSVFYGLRLDGAELIFETGDGDFVQDDFATWTITLPGVDFVINDDGHLSMQF